MPDPFELDLSSLLGDTPSPPQALAAALRARQLAAAGQLSGNRGIMASAKGLEEGANADVQRSVQAQHFALQAAPQLEQMKARRDPRYAQVLRQQAGGYGLDIPEGTPPLVLEHLLDREAKLQAASFGQQKFIMSGWQLKKTADGGMAYVNSHSGEVRAAGPDGSMGAVISPGRAPTRSFLPGATGFGAPPAPTAAAAPPAPTGGAPAAAPPPRPPIGAPQAPPVAPAGSAAFPPLKYDKLSKALQALGNDFDTNKGTGEVANNQKRLNAALRLKALVTNPDGSLKTMIPPQFMTEVAAALAQMVNSGGVPAQSLVEHLTAKTGGGDLAKWTQYITGSPQDAGQGDFVKLYLESAEREAGVAEQALRQAIGSRAGKHQAVLKGNPRESAELLKGFGWELTPTGELKRAEEPAVAGHGPAAGGGPAKLVTVKTADEARALPKGTRFQPVKPDGTPDGPPRIR